MNTAPTRTLFSPVHRTLNLRETVLEQLRTAIITGELAEGTLVSAPSLGQILEVSATPVREAMMDLAREGLVEAVKNKGFRITTASEKDQADLTEIRVFLEPPAMHAVARRIPSDAPAPLTYLADACLRAAEEQDLAEYLRNDREFHAMLLSYAGNPQLVELATSLRIRTRLYGIATLAGNGTLVDSAREHHKLIELVCAGDGENAATLLASHISRARVEGETTTAQ